MQDGEEKAQQEDDTKGIEMEGDFEGQMEDLPPNDDSASEEDGDEDRLQQEMGDVGEAGDTVDERLWNEEDKPEESQQGPPKKEDDSTVQASLFERATVIIVIFFFTASGERCLSCILTAVAQSSPCTMSQELHNRSKADGRIGLLCFNLSLLTQCQS